MREIKFRVYDTREKKYLIADETFVFILTKNGELHFMSEITIDIPQRFIIEQFTGLYDKNGKEIYEGDIVREIPSDTTAVIEYNTTHGMAGFVGRVLGGIHKDHKIVKICELQYQIEIIGNIHEGTK